MSDWYSHLMDRDGILGGLDELRGDAKPGNGVKAIKEWEERTFDQDKPVQPAARAAE